MDMSPRSCAAARRTLSRPVLRLRPQVRGPLAPVDCATGPSSLPAVRLTPITAGPPVTPASTGVAGLSRPQRWPWGLAARRPRFSAAVAALVALAATAAPASGALSRPVSQGWHMRNYHDLRYPASYVIHVHSHRGWGVCGGMRLAFRDHGRWRLAPVHVHDSYCVNGGPTRNRRIAVRLRFRDRQVLHLLRRYHHLRWIAGFGFYTSRTNYSHSLKYDVSEETCCEDSR